MSYEENLITRSRRSEFTVCYDNTDTGIFLRHENCGWEELEGYWPSIDLLDDEIERHIASCLLFNE